MTINFKLIKKYFDEKILNAYSNSSNSTYSCNYLNNKMSKETILYDSNGSPTTENITLTDSKDNYDELCISGCTNTECAFTIRVSTSDTFFRISVVDNNGTGTNAWLKLSNYTLADKKITVSSAFWREINSNATGTDNALLINKVIGIKH